MSRYQYRSTAAAMTIVVVMGLGALAHACNVPVFRFALEHWRPDPYRVVLFHRGSLGDAERQLVRTLEEKQDNRLANVAVNTVDLAEEGEPSEAVAKDRALYEALGKPALPWLVVQYPTYLRIDKPAWAGPLSSDLVNAALESPLRRELASRLAEGQTAVWLLLESGEAEKDNEVAGLVEERLKKLEKDLKLPELTDSPADALATTLPLEINFSLLRVPRNVPAEHALVAMLIGSEPDLAERSDPMLFPVFGRGRALLPLIGAGITEQNIHEAAQFLAGPCSCEVKEQNPGFDLMVSVDWEDLLLQHGVAVAATETRAEPTTSEPVLVPIPTGSPPVAISTPPLPPPPVAIGTPPSPPPPPPTPSEALQNSTTSLVTSPRTWLIAGGIACGLLTLGILFLTSRRD